VNVIEDAFGAEVDYAQLHKVYRAPLENETRYSPAKCIGCDLKAVSGNPDYKYVSTSFVERQNWTVRATMRRYTRLSNGLSRKLESHAAATALNYFAYNFIEIHRTLRVSPALAAGVSERLWSVEDVGSLLGSLRAAEGGKSGIGVAMDDNHQGEEFCGACDDWVRIPDNIDHHDYETFWRIHSERHSGPYKPPRSFLGNIWSRIGYLWERISHRISK
jgi:hypothetical protein